MLVCVRSESMISMRNDVNAMETMPVTFVLSLRISRKKIYTLVDIFCFEEQSSVILVIKLELQHSGLATAEVKSILGFFPYMLFICGCNLV